MYIKDINTYFRHKLTKVCNINMQRYALHLCSVQIWLFIRTLYIACNIATFARVRFNVLIWYVSYLLPEFTTRAKLYLYVSCVFRTYFALVAFCPFRVRVGVYVVYYKLYSGYTAGDLVIDFIYTLNYRYFL